MDAADETKVSSLSDQLDDGISWQFDAADADEKFAAMTPDVAVAAAKKMLVQRHHRSKINFNNCSHLMASFLGQPG